MARYFKTDQGGLTVFSWAEIAQFLAQKRGDDSTADRIDEQIGRMTNTETERRIRALQAEQQRLLEALGDIDRDEVDAATEEDLERENEALRDELAQRREAAKGQQLRGNQMTKQDQFAALRTLNDLVQKAQGDFVGIRKRADDVYQSRVEDLAAEHGCSMSEAHRKAAQDPVAKRAYAIGVEAQNRQVAAMRGASAVAAYLGR